MAEPHMKEWITVKEAAVLTGKAERTIYEWIEDQRLAVRRNATGVMEVLAKAVLRLEPTIRRGRPRGKPTRR
jgi:hypothetical protein